MLELFVAMKHIRTRKRQTALAVGAVGLAVAIIIVFRAVMNGSIEIFFDLIFELAPHVLVLPKEGEEYIYLYKTLIEFIWTIPGVAAVSPTLSTTATLSFEDEVENVELTGGIPAEMNRVMSLEKYMIEGDFYAISSGRRAILGEGVAEKLDVKIGEDVVASFPDAKTMNLVVAGVFRTGIEEWDGAAYVSLNTAQEFLGEGDVINYINIHLDDPYQADEVAEEISALLRSIISMAFADVVANSGIGVLDLAQRYGSLSETLRREVLSKIDDEFGLDDMDARILITELAPWSSVVQRLGRCNRKGEHSDAEVKWIDVMGAASAPYDAAELEVSRERLRALEGTDVCPSSLHPADSLTRPSHVIRRRDIIGLFDTTPDISGSYVDPGRFIRDANDLAVQVFWREVPIGESPPDDAPSPVPAELCAVPVYSVRDFLREPSHRAWIWDHLTESWARLLPARATPGQMVMVSSDSGGYSADYGWAPKSVDPVPALS
ncbi:MAG TPA: ABC transporter permease, partial [Methanothrix sp.]|nr:ABC transporter permease [Methanothrix sp.]